MANIGRHPRRSPNRSDPNEIQIRAEGNPDITFPASWPHSIACNQARQNQLEASVLQFHQSWSSCQSSSRSPAGDIFTSLGSNWPSTVTRFFCAAITSPILLEAIGTSSTPTLMSVTPRSWTKRFTSFQWNCSFAAWPQWPRLHRTTAICRRRTLLSMETVEEGWNLATKE